MGSDYIVNGEVARNRIALDIKYRKLNRMTIEQLISDPKIASAFIGSSFNKKRPKRDWNKTYLDELSYAAVAESFNSDYLLYLDEVANYVVNARFKKLLVAGAMIVFVLVMVFMILV